ncbi:MAG: GyrI-like domain-containing protein [Anaerolineales bacterium]|nr:GyrI-like domain-containing protein [Anaerolineales bacterium]
MDPEILERGKMNLVGMTYYGPIGGAGWSEENQIGKLWQRFNKFCETKWGSIEDRAINPKLGYEVSIWNEDEFKETGGFCIFVGVEVDHLEEVPLELFGKVLPAGTYAYFTPKGKEITTWEDDFYKGWLIKSGYQLSAVGNYSFQVQCYEDGRFKGVDNLEESEIDVYIPIEPAK